MTPWLHRKGFERIWLYWLLILVIVACLCISVVARQVWAGEYPHKNLTVCDLYHNTPECVNIGAVIQPTFQTDCEHRMEAVMRKMDEFVHPFGVEDTVAIYITPAEQLRRQADRIERQEKAVTEWEAVKKDCWRH